MQHAAEISAGDSSDSKMERAIRQRDYFLQQLTASEQISKTIQSGYKYGVSAAVALKPENVSKTMKYAVAKFRTLTWAQLFVEIFKLGYRLGKGILMLLVFVVMTFFRFVFYLTSPEESKESMDRSPSLAPHAEHLPTHQTTNMPFFQKTHYNVDAFGINIRTDEANGVPPSMSPPNFVDEPTPSNDHAMHSNQAGYSSSDIPEDPRQPNENVPTDESNEDDNLLKPPQATGQRRSPSVYDTQSFASQPMHVSVPSVVQQEDVRLSYYEPKIAEQFAMRSKGSVLNVLARNFKTIEKITLYLAFFINVILLFHRVDIAINNNGPSKPNMREVAEDEDEEDGVDEVMESVYITGMIVPYFSYEITGWLLSQVGSRVFRYGMN